HGEWFITFLIDAVNLCGLSVDAKAGNDGVFVAEIFVDQYRRITDDEIIRTELVAIFIKTAGDEGLPIFHVLEGVLIEHAPFHQLSVEPTRAHTIKNKCRSLARQAWVNQRISQRVFGQIDRKRA